MTQVIGKAPIETFFCDQFKIDVSQPVLTVKLLTHSGQIPIRIEIRDEKVVRVTTLMDNYLSYVYAAGIEPL